MRLFKTFMILLVILLHKNILYILKVNNAKHDFLNEKNVIFIKKWQNFDPKTVKFGNFA